MFVVDVLRCSGHGGTPGLGLSADLFGPGDGLHFLAIPMIIIRMYICVCNAITERQVRECVAAGATTLADLQFDLGVATCCGCCAQTAQEYLPGGRYASEGSVCNQAQTHTHTAHFVSTSISRGTAPMTISP